MSQLLFLAMKTVSLATVLAFVFHIAQSQLNPAFTQNPASSGTGTNTFYFDSASDCNKATIEIYASKAIIKGSDPSSVRQGQTTCTIRLQSTGQFDSTILDIEVISMNIQDCDIQVSIYDGNGAQLLMMTYDCRSSQNQNRKRFITSGNTVTFMMARRNINSVNFDIEIAVSPIRAGIDPSDQNNFGSDYYFDKFPQAAVVGLIGAFYAIIIIICTVIIIFFTRSYWGMNKQWETHQLATMQTGTMFDKKHPPASVWSVEAKQKQGLAVTNFKMQKNMTSKTVDDCGILYNDQVLQKHFMSEGRDEAKPRYVSSSASFIATGEDSERLREKINAHHIKARKNQKQPPSYNDTSDLTSDYSSSNDESDVTSIDSSVKRQSLTSVDITLRSPKSEAVSDDTESITDEAWEDSSPRKTGRNKIKKHNVQHKMKQRKQDVNSFSQPNPSHSRLLPSQPQQVPYNAYPTGHFLPLMTGVPPFQPPHIFPPLQPPTYADKLGGQVQPIEPPVYSYLVRRGYTPLDVNQSQRPVVKQLEGPVLRLESGVEYMKR